MTITAILGDIGSGKTLKLLAHACQMANNKQKKLVLNFAVNLQALREYASLMNYGWLCYLIDTNQVVCLQLADYAQMLQIFARPKTVAVIDEAQIFFNSRNFKNTPLNVLADLCLSRHDAIDVIWCAQVDTHVDVQFRQLTQFFIHARGMSRYDKELRNEQLMCKIYFHFKGSTYEMWLSDLKARRGNIRGFLRTWFMYAQKVEIAPLSATDIKLFECFSSFNRLDKEVVNNNQEIVYKFKFQQVSWNGLLSNGVDTFLDDKSLIIRHQIVDTINQVKSHKKSVNIPQRDLPDWQSKLGS